MENVSDRMPFHMADKVSLLNGHVTQKKEPNRKYRWLVGVLVFVFATALYFFDVGTYTNYQIPHPGNLAAPAPTVFTTPSGFLVYTPGCRIPDYDPFDASILKFVRKEKTINCSAASPLVESNLTSLMINASVLPYYNLSSVEELECCYTNFWRVKGNPVNYSYGADNKFKYNKTCTPFVESVTVDKEFVRVVCKVNGTEIYRDFHAFVPLKLNVESRCRQAASNAPWHLLKGEDVQEEADKVSVLIIGVDAVSRLNFHRTMPKTLSFLTNELNAFEMLGYNKVADNTFVNIVPVMAGMTEEELQSFCWPNSKTKLDDCPWLWKNYSKAGYRTVYGEDSPWMGIFNYVKVGFVNQPTDYYLRPYMKNAEDEAGHTKMMNAKLCVGPRKTMELVLNYIRKLAIFFSSELYFAFFWITSLTHDYLNFPQLGDEDYAVLLSDLLRSGALNKTILIFMSDHGIRWGGIRETYQGSLEERLPFLFFSFPDWFARRYSGAMFNLRRNVHKLTTPFDLHETLKDILSLQDVQKANLDKRSKALLETVDDPPRGISMFLPIPNKRTCNDSGVEPHWCTCQMTQTVPLSDERVRKASDFLVDHINGLLKPYRQCANLKLKTVKDARIQLPLKPLHELAKDHLTDYSLVIEVSPSDGIFEGTVRYKPSEKSFQIAGIISRINRYGDQSNCVADYHMKLYCYCKK